MRIVLLFLSFFYTCMVNCEQKTSILVSIPAYTEFVQELSGNLATVYCLIPANVSFHTYEPRPKDIEKAFSCSLWFALIDPFEDKFAQALLSHHPSTKRVDLRTNLPIITSPYYNATTDPHIWLNPHLMKIQLDTIAHALQEEFPKHKQEINLRLSILKEKMNHLINQVDTLLKPMQGKIIVIAHGAYTYLCKQYEIEQLCLEQEGKEPSLTSFTTLIQKAKEHHVKTIFSLKQHPKNAIEKTAELLGARIINLDPYAEKYFENILFTAQSFHEALNEQVYNQCL